MKDRQISISRHSFQVVRSGERLLALAFAIISELREIKELLRIQNERGNDARLFTVDEAAEKKKVPVRLMAEWEKAGKLPSVHLLGKRYYQEKDLE
ncbi:hypothetical protein B0I27_101245 [Arcticibacter pallidicorallinus]|uniref:Helix-turn-helix protein n=1 Tax=Arcticibacter pallidicorallinus TaxID=1259464 RepID=A0A2T0UBF8_9SPHI|nr:DNA-binding protein [Arcticibacter pallidicorallinus]PRY55276.1 hypothetical protein B0I27_101245 [Arcticibacter pallidicorallinus]